MFILTAGAFKKILFKLEWNSIILVLHSREAHSKRYTYPLLYAALGYRSLSLPPSSLPLSLFYFLSPPPILFFHFLWTLYTPHAWNQNSGHYQNACSCGLTFWAIFFTYLIHYSFTFVLCKGKSWYKPCSAAAAVSSASTSPRLEPYRWELSELTPWSHHEA